MTNLTYFPRFIPLSNTSTNPLFYYDSNASLEVLFDAIQTRMAAIYYLLTFPYEGIDSVKSLFTRVATAVLLIEEVRALLHEFDPIALQLRREKE